MSLLNFGITLEMAPLRDRDRGPDDFDSNDPRYLRGIIEELIRTQRGDYHEKGNNVWTAGIGATLLTAFIVGGWSLSNQVAGNQAEEKAQQISTQRQIDELKSEVQDLRHIIEQRVRP